MVELPDDVRLWLLRHGETEWSASGRHTGRTDIDLTPAGRGQARALRPILTGVGDALVLCSPRRRALGTAALAGLTVDAIDEDLAEWDYGDYEGLTTDRIRADRPNWTLWRDGVPGGETIEQVTTRADRLLRRVRTALAERPVVLVAHGHICRVLGARWIGRPARFGENLLLGTSAICTLGVQYGEPVLDRWNVPNPVVTVEPDPRRLSG